MVLSKMVREIQEEVLKKEVSLHAWRLHLISHSQRIGRDRVVKVEAQYLLGPQRTYYTSGGVNGVNHTVIYSEANRCRWNIRGRRLEVEPR